MMFRSLSHFRTVGRRWRPALAALLAGGLVGGAPAAAEDSKPTGPVLRGCQFFGGEVPSGTPIVAGPGMTSQMGIPGQPAGHYICMNGQWMYIGPIIGPNGPIFMEGGPQVTLDNASVAVAEGTTATNSGLVTTPTTPVALSATLGTVADLGGGSWSWNHTPTDGPTQTQNVSVTATAGDKVGADSFLMAVENVAPTVTSLAPDRTTALVGQPVTFTGAATDPSPEDTLAGFSWSFDGAPSPGDFVATSFAHCGAGTVTAAATDKDGGTSAEATSAPVQVVDARFVAPLQPGTYNLVRAGQVVPVRVEIGCDGETVGDLSPAIQVLNGEVDPITDADDPAQAVATTSVSSADTGTVMRAADGAYVYNLRIPSAAAGSLFTVRVRPVADSTHAVYAVLRIR